jgi:glycosyltransferase involved in cell wall biosynthesis
MPLISVVTPCYNEEGNVELLREAVKHAFEALPGYTHEHIFIDNASQDGTVAVLKKLAANDVRVKIIVNTRNFGVVSSPLHAIFQAKGEAIIPLAADLQDPPELIPEFIRKWSEGFKIVAAVKRGSTESFPMREIRNLYYRILSFISESETIRNFSGYGLYDREVIEILRSTGDHNPYTRGLIVQMGFPIATIEYVRPTRKHGWSKNSLYDLYCQAMNGITAQSKAPLRMATFTGLIIAILSFLVGAGYLVYKLLYWNNFTVGVAPLVCGLFFFGAVQLMFLGIVGEYIGSIHSRVFQRWLVIEKERINFDGPPSRETAGQREHLSVLSSGADV